MNSVDKLKGDNQKDMLQTYLSNICQKYIKGQVREESYYSILSELLKSYAESNNIKADITELPAGTKAGNPDFRVWDGIAHITGYIEAKKPEEDNLDKIEASEQLKRYISTFPNVILTNFFEFRLYRQGEMIEKVTIGRFFTLQELKHEPILEKAEDFLNLLDKFFSFKLPRINTAKALAEELAKRTRFLRDEVIKAELEEETNTAKQHKPITGFYDAFKQYLIAGLGKEQFADLYSQTLTYGLFAARSRAADDFNRELAYKYIPNTIGILKDIFRYISLEDPPLSLIMLIDDIAEILKVTNVKKILRKYYEEGKGTDPVIHFYETFLSVYDPNIKVTRGVYYTPEPAVKYIVKSLHQILKDEFGKPDGFASDNVTVLDPAAGTLTFPAEAIKLAVEENKKYGEAAKDNLIKNNILKNFYAFELMMAPYAIGHLKMGFIFDELGYRMKDDERFNLYLTNTLEMEELEQVHIPGLSSLAEESHLALEVKRDKPVLVIMGNPPYSGISSNNNAWTHRLLTTNIDGAQSYYEVDGKPLGERNPKWLQDDYVKFLRFAQWKIQKAGKGVVGMITNHGYLDNPTFRGMRQSLIKTFNKIYIINLHGNSKKRETCPDGSKDENVFDIMQGVAIAIFIKTNTNNDCRVFYNDMYGLRKEKYKILGNRELSDTDFADIQPNSPYYFLIQRNTENIEYYKEWFSIKEIFPLNGVGITTARDSFITDFDKHNLFNRVYQFKNSQENDETLHKSFGINKKKGWDIRKAWVELQKFNNDELMAKINMIEYRPFQIKYIFYDDSLVWRTVKIIMGNMKETYNIGLVIGRQGQVVGDNLWNLSFITDKISDFNIFYRGGGVLLPLYLHKDKNSHDIIDQLEPDKKANISDKVVQMLNRYYDFIPASEEILYYIYGVFYSNIYREKYREYLKIDFPRVPFTSDAAIFKEMSALGERLAGLHLLKSKELDPPLVRYEGSGEDHKIEKIQYKHNRVYINDSKYFEGIEPEVWEYQIGGYQVMHKYLKDRKGRIMEDPKHYCRVATSLSKTIEIQGEIDEVYKRLEDKILGEGEHEEI